MILKERSLALIKKKHIVQYIVSNELYHFFYFDYMLLVAHV